MILLVILRGDRNDDCAVGIFTAAVTVAHAIYSKVSLLGGCIYNVAARTHAE